MLTPLILTKIYTKQELISRLGEVKSRIEAYSSGDDILEINESNLGVKYGASASKDELVLELESIVEALQILDPHTFGTDLLQPTVKYVY